MTTKPEFSAEVLNGYLLIAVKVPTSTCTACGAVWTPTVTPEDARRGYDCGVPIQQLFGSPWGHDEWKFIYTDGRHALVCGACAAPLTEAEREGQVKADAAAREICKKIDTRFQTKENENGRR
jgi:hypothetical protein